MIEEISEDAQKAFPAIVEKWAKIGLSTEPADRPRAEQAFRDLYDLVELKKPEQVIWVESPVVGGVAANIAATIIASLCHRIGEPADRANRQIGAAIYPAVRKRVDETVSGAIDAACVSVHWSVEAATRAAADVCARQAIGAAIKAIPNVDIFPSARMIIEGGIRTAVNTAAELTIDSYVRAAADTYTSAVVRAAGVSAAEAVILEAVRSVTYAVCRDAVIGAVETSLQGSDVMVTRAASGLPTERGRPTQPIMWPCGGQFNAPYMAWVESLCACGADFRNLQQLTEPYAAVAESVGYWWAHDNFIIACDRPRVIRLDDQQRPHCGNAAAIEWRDGFKLHAWHGVAVPANVIEAPATITVEQIKNEAGVEIRRIMRERYGEGRYLVDSGARVIDVDYERARKGAAPRCLLEDFEGRRFLVGCDGSTERVYYMEVDNTIETCRGAHESLCGFDETMILNKS